MAQHGDAVTAKRFFELALTPYPMPTLAGTPPPPGDTQGHSVAGKTTNSNSYAVNDEEKARYDGIFAQYDTDHDGYLLGSEAVNLFGMSGLDRTVRNQ